MKIDYKNNRLNEFLSIYTTIGNKDDCWIWTGPVDKKLGYGRTSFIGEKTTAHRTSYILAYGDYLKVIKERKTCIRHLCNNRLCINPYHLALGTYGDNSRDASTNGIGVKMDIKKLTKALELKNKGLTYRKIGKIIGVSSQVTAWSLNGKSHYCKEMLKEINRENNSHI